MALASTSDLASRFGNDCTELGGEKKIFLRLNQPVVCDPSRNQLHVSLTYRKSAPAGSDANRSPMCDTSSVNLLASGEHQFISRLPGFPYLAVSAR